MSDVADGNNIQKTDQIKGSSGHLFFNATKIETGYGPDIVEDHSFVQLAHNDHAQISLQAGGKIRTDAMSDMSINVHRNMFENILGDSKVSIGRDQTVTVEGALNITVGRYGSDEKDAEKKLQKLAKEIQTQSIATAKATTNNRIPCKICNSKVLVQPSALKAEISASQAIRVMEDTGLGSRFKSIADKLLRILQAVPKMFNIKTTASFYTKTKSCGSPGCINHTVEDLNASLNVYNKTATSLLEENKTLIEELHQKLGKGTGGLTLVTKGACLISTGLVKNEANTHFNKGNHTLGLGLQQDPSGMGLGGVLSSKGSPSRMIQVKTPKFTESDMFLNASGKFTVNAGADGILLETNGPLQALGSSVEIHSTDGEAHFSSGNLTVISGATVKVQADMKTGETGIILESKSVHATGRLSAQGDLIVRGGAHFDGAVSVPFLQVPSCEQNVRESKPPQMVTGPASWMPKNTILNTIQEVNDNLTTLAADPFYLCTPTNLQEYIKKWYGLFIGSIPLEMTVTGWAIALSYGVNGGGPMVSKGLWKTGLIPVLNYPHNHEKYNEYHGGSVTMPLFGSHDLSEGRSAAGVHGSHIPLPPPINSPIGMRPGKISQPGPCGGGGIFVKNRNLDYGTDALDPFNGLNYVDRGTNNGLNMYNNTPEFSNYKYGILPSLSGSNVGNNNSTDCT
jgi:hypothetical protein